MQLIVIFRGFKWAPLLVANCCWQIICRRATAFCLGALRVCQAVRWAFISTLNERLHMRNNIRHHC